MASPATPVVTEPVATPPASESAHAPIPDTANYDELLKDDLGGETPPEVPETPVAPATGGEPKPSGEQPKPVVPVPVAEPVVTPPTPQPVAAPVAQPQSPAPAAPQPQPVPAAEPGPEVIKAEREKLMTSLEQAYQFSPDEATELAVSPEKVLPRLAARITAQVFDGILQTIGQNLPRMIENYQQSRDVQQSAWDGFAKTYPVLNKPEYYPVISRVSQTIKQLNPDLKGEEAYKHIAIQSAMLLNLDPSSLGGQPPTPAAPVQPPARMHTPANPGGSASGGGAKPEPNPFDVILREFEDLDTR